MSMISTVTECWELNRFMTTSLLDAIAEMPDPKAVLGWRPGPGRAHIAWQLMHIGITEELFATERLLGQSPEYSELVPRFKGGSQPDDDIPEINTIREVLETSRSHLLSTVSAFSESDLETIPEPLREKGWSLGQVLKILTWHEGHHQGQAHLTLNLYKNS